MQATGGADLLAHLLLVLLSGATPAVILSAFFLLVAGLSNVLSTKATAVLFTPIAVGIALELGVPIEPFAVTMSGDRGTEFSDEEGHYWLEDVGVGSHPIREEVPAGSRQTTGDTTLVYEDDFSPESFHADNWSSSSIAKTP